MKKVLLIIFSLLFLNVQAFSLKGGISEEYIPNGFFGSWGVISKLDSSNNPKLFNMESRDIWTLSGHSDVLVLQNLQSGARSEIRVKEKAKDGKTLKFQREKTANTDNGKIVYREIVNFSLWGNNFSGTDKFYVEKYDKSGVLLEKNEAKYVVEGVKISGEKP